MKLHRNNWWICPLLIAALLAGVPPGVNSNRPVLFDFTAITEVEAAEDPPKEEAGTGGDKAREPEKETGESQAVNTGDSNETTSDAGSADKEAAKPELPLLDLSTNLTESKQANNGLPAHSGVLSGGATAVQEMTAADETQEGTLPQGQIPFGENFPLGERQKTLSFGTPADEQPANVPDQQVQLVAPALPQPAKPDPQPVQTPPTSKPASPQPQQEPVVNPATQAAPLVQPPVTPTGTGEEAVSRKTEADEPPVNIPAQEVAPAGVGTSVFEETLVEDYKHGEAVQNELPLNLPQPQDNKEKLPVAGLGNTAPPSSDGASPNQGSGLVSSIRNVILAILAAVLLLVVLVALWSLRRTIPGGERYRVQESIEVELGWRIMVVESELGTILLGVSPGSVNLLAELPMNSQDVRYANTINRLVIDKLKQPQTWQSQPLFAPVKHRAGMMPPLTAHPQTASNVVDGRLSETEIREKLKELFQVQTPMTATVA